MFFLKHGVEINNKIKLHILGVWKNNPMNKSDNQSIPDLNDNAAMVIVYLGLRT